MAEIINPDSVDASKIMDTQPTSIDIITTHLSDPRKELLEDYDYLVKSRALPPEHCFEMSGNLTINTSENRFDIEKGCSLLVALSRRFFRGYYLRVDDDSYFLRKREPSKYNSEKVVAIHDGIDSTPHIEVLKQCSDDSSKLVDQGSYEYLKVATVFHVLSDALRNIEQ
ncbi:hypothetical protein DYH10_00115 [Candidatus Saccharibacteria bacterium CPR2]|nr:hypothetical protein [Candidatus Saccharibacteria bacterium CPR2]